MGKLIKHDTKDPLAEVVSNIDTNKFWIPITTDILLKNGWECYEDEEHLTHWFPIIDEKSDEYDPDFEDFSIWFWESKNAWCYRYSFGTYVYDIKSIGALEIILGCEGFIYEFDV